ncbi:MAG TPA: hypothetical protein PLC72_18745 [Candidatus Hydrogenedentes bacterium]|nr:hypothetical protein [Candidatus Hydrogenedentota bacterium]
MARRTVPGREQAAFSIDADELRGALQNAVKKIGVGMADFLQDAKGRAQKRAPVGWDIENRLPGGAKTKKPRGYRGGTHRRNIHAEWDSASMRGNIHTEDGYGGYLHIGTKHMAARPDILPGFMEAFRDWERRAEGSL